MRLSGMKLYLDNMHSSNHGCSTIYEQELELALTFNIFSEKLSQDLIFVYVLVV